MKPSRRWGFSFRGGHPKKEAPAAKVLAIFIFYKTSYKYFPLLAPSLPRETHTTQPAPICEREESWADSELLRGGSFSTYMFSSGQEMGLESAVRAIQVPHAEGFLFLFLSWLRESASLPPYHVRTGPLAITGQHV